MKNILITGGAGFIGSNFLHYFLGKHGSEFDSVVCLDLLTYAGNLQNLEGLEAYKNYHFVKGDICDKALVAELFAKFHIDAVIHFAAESHVDNSIASPEIFIKTNVYGTFTLLQTAYSAWFDAPFCAKSGFENALFHHISTDEVYGTLGATGLFSERTPYAPNSPYSASKASSDFVVRSYAHTYGLNAVITNCSNNYGPRQHAEKLIPTIIRKALRGEQIPIYGDGQNVRDWLFVNDHCEGICAVFEYAQKQIASKAANEREREREESRDENSLSTKANFATPQAHSGYFDTFNIGGNEERQNIDIARLICAYLDKRLPKSKPYAEQIRFVKDRAGHDRRYAIDASKLRQKLGWQPKHSFAQGIEKTIEWFITNSLGKAQTEFG